MFSPRSSQKIIVAVLGIALTSVACAKSTKESQRAQESCVDRTAALPVENTEAPSILGVCEEDGLTAVFAMRKQGALVSLNPGDASFALARFVTADTQGNPGRWQNFFNRFETPGAGDWPGTVPKIQATTDNRGELRALGNGLFAYTFSGNPMQTTGPVQVAWEPDQVHRLGIEFRGDAEDPSLGNPIYTWIPSTGAATSPVHKVVSNESCNECHARLEAHGGPRTSVDYCVLCHNPGSTDAQSGNTVDFKVMIHKIHRWSNGTTSYPQGDYKIWGFQNTEHDYTHVQFPQDQRNCRKCHDPKEEETPSADLFLAGGNIETCTSCHNQVSFAATVPDGKIPHPGGPASDNSTCAGCHGPQGNWSVEKSHLTIVSTPNNPLIPESSGAVAYFLSDVALANATQPTAKFRITFNEMNVDVATTPADFKLDNFPQLRVIYSAPEGSVAAPADWNNIDNNQPVGQPAGISIKNNVAKFIKNADGSYTVPPGVLPDVPADVTMLAVGIEGASQVDLDGSGTFTNAERIAGDSVVVGSGITGSPRRDIVNTGKCNLCHERLSAHGNNRANNVRICAACHNPNASDILQRPATLDLDTNGAFDDFTTVGVDGLHERSIDFRELIHKIHYGDQLTQQYTVYGFGRSVHTFNEVRFPGRPGNCLTCHNESTFTVPLIEGALATTRLSALAATNAVELRSPTDDLNVSPTGAACTGCHDSQATQAHAMTSRFYWSSNLSGTESDSCAVCHGEGQPYDVSAVHPVAELTSDFKKYTPAVVQD